MPAPKGHKRYGGREKGVPNKMTQTKQEIFVQVLEEQADHIQEALEKVRVKDPAKYLDIMSKMAQYFIAKKVEQVGETIIRVKTPEDK